MDTEELSRKYMGEYNALTKDFDDLGIENTVSELNEAISHSDMEKTNKLYNQLLEWNSRVAGIEAVRDSLNSQFRYLRLPSAVLFGVTFDGDDKTWKFNTKK